jgi:uncharacterized RDD family membrane protein YckC
MIGKQCGATILFNFNKKGGKPGDDPVDRLGDRPGSRPLKRPGTRTGDRTSNKPASRYADPPLDEPNDDLNNDLRDDLNNDLNEMPPGMSGSMPGARPVSGSGNRPVNRSGGRPGSRPGARPGDKPAKGGLFGLFPAKGPKNKPSGLKTSKVKVFQDWLASRRLLYIVEPEHIEPGRRLMAIGIDFGACFLISMVTMMIPLVNRFLDQNIVMLCLMCVRDYFYSGRGLGKNIMGLKVVDIFTGQAPSLRAAIVRNLIYIGPLLFLWALHLILGIIPFPQLNGLIGQVGNFLATLYVLVILPVECYRSYQREDSMRLGDEVAGTCILESETDFTGLLPK